MYALSFSSDGPVDPLCMILEGREGEVGRQKADRERGGQMGGQGEQARCGVCNWVCNYEPHLFQGSDSLYCQRCLQRSQARILKGKRSLNIGRLRPNVLLYGEPHPDDKEILEAARHDLRICPELVLIVGTKLAIPGARSIASDFCNAARSVGGVSFWISKEEPMWSVKSLCDYVLIEDRDKVIP